MPWSGIARHMALLCFTLKKLPNQCCFSYSDQPCQKIEFCIFNNTLYSHLLNHASVYAV